MGMAPETQDDVNTTQIENGQQLMHDLNPHLFGNMTVTVVDGHVVHGAVVNGAVVNEPVVTTTAAATTTTTVKVSEEESGFLINSVSICDVIYNDSLFTNLYLTAIPVCS